MSEIEQLKKRIDESGMSGLETAYIRDDYDPAGDLMINHLTGSGEYVTRKVPMHDFNAKWRVYKAGMEPY